MTSSIRTFLLINLLLSITFIISLAIIADIFIERAELRKHLDAHLKLVAVSIETFLSQDNIEKTNVFITNKTGKSVERFAPSTIRVLQYQIWDSPEGDLVLKPTYFKNKLLAYSKEGFSDQEIDGDPWRVYTSLNSEKNIKLILAERYDFRRNLEGKLVKDSVFILLATYPILGLLIWVIVGKGFSSLNGVVKTLRSRKSAKLEPFHFPQVPVEIQPLVNELNNLFGRLKRVFEREKRFAADAAHELRTPLAVIKAQSQLALKTKDPAVKDEALKKLITGVDRSSHVVNQLLTLSRMESQDIHVTFEKVDVVKEARETIALLVPKALEKNIEIELNAVHSKASIQGISAAIGILIRNLVDNAIRYTQEGGKVEVVVESTSKSVVLRVIDNGPGIDPGLRDRVFERFYRVLGTDAKGTGLGLGIVRQIVKIHNAEIALETPASGKGLEIIVSFPAKKVVK